MCTGTEIAIFPYFGSHCCPCWAATCVMSLVPLVFRSYPCPHIQGQEYLVPADKLNIYLWIIIYLGIISLCVCSQPCWQRYQWADTSFMYLPIYLFICLFIHWLIFHIEFLLVLLSKKCQRKAEHKMRFFSSWPGVNLSSFLWSDANFSG